jgi:hypothetical protein
MSLDLVRRVAVGLRDSAVDDTHLSTRWGDLLENLASRLQSRLTQPSTPKTSNVRLPSSAALSKGHADAFQVSHETNRPTIHYAPQDIQPRADLEDNDLLDLNQSSSDAKHDPQFDAWSMWWDDQFSQVNLNYMPWFPTLGLVGGNDPPFSNDAADGLFGSAGPTH